MMLSQRQQRKGMRLLREASRESAESFATVRRQVEFDRRRHNLKLQKTHVLLSNKVNKGLACDAIQQVDHGRLMFQPK